MSRFLVLLTIIGSFSAIYNRNQLREKAYASFHDRDYKKSIVHLENLLDSLSDTIVPAIFFNQGLAAENLEDTNYSPQAYYTKALEEKKMYDEGQSYAAQNLAAAAFNGKQIEQAIAFSITSLKKNPNNFDSRYNLEMLLKLKKQQDQQQNQEQDQQQNQEQDQQQNQDQQNQEKEGKEKKKENQNQSEGNNQQNDPKGKKGDNGNQKKDQPGKEKQGEQKAEGGEKEDKLAPQPVKPDAEKLKEMGLSEEKVKAILNAMKNTEVQYLQQLKKNPERPPDPNKPDW